MVELILKHLEELRIFERQRLMWLRLSGFVFFTVVLIIADYLWVGQKDLYWPLFPIGLVLTVTWWYWTMKIIRSLIRYRETELEIMKELLTDIKEVKQGIRILSDSD